VARPSTLLAVAGQFALEGAAFFSVHQTRFGGRPNVPAGLGELGPAFERAMHDIGMDAGQTTFRFRAA
jgi:hypothetical protein